jgi:hypothetical protein
MSTEVNVGIFARQPQRGFQSRQVIVWMAAYALALQTVLAPLLAAPMQVRRGADGATLFALCLAGHAAAPASQDIPGGNHDPDIHCKLCVHGGPTFAGTPSLGTASITATASTRLRWPVSDNPAPDSAGFIGEHARGPPLLI